MSGSCELSRAELMWLVGLITMTLQKDISKTQVQALINLESEINAIHPTFAKQLGLPIRPIDVRA